MKKEFKIKAKVWRWPGDGGWYFVTLDRKLSADIRSAYPKGFVKIVAKVGKSEWNTSLFPHVSKLSDKKHSGILQNMRMINERRMEYILCVNKKVRRDEGIFEGDEIRVCVVIQ